VSRSRRSKAAPKAKPDVPADAPASAPPASAPWRAHVVAVFVLFHVAASCAYVVPDLRAGLDRRAWADARAQRELGVWAERLGVEQRELEDRLYAIGLGYERTRQGLTSPLEPYSDISGLRQSWAMFAAGTVESDRFGLRVRRCPLGDARCAWEPLYVHADDAHAWDRAVLGHPRVRSAIFRWGWPSYAGAYARGCEALARRVFDALPDVAAVECGFERSTLPSPSLPSPPEPTWGRTRVVARESVTR
jgi:hypothetical protein